MKFTSSVTGDYNPFSVNTESDLFQKSIQLRIARLLIILAIALMAGCATTGGYKEAVTDDPKSTDLKIYGQFDPDFSSEYFGSFRFAFENITDQWINIDSIQLSFDNDSARKYIKVLDQYELEQWAKSVLLQTNLHTSTIKDLQSALINTGSNISSIVGDVSKEIGIDSGEQKKTYPNNHLYADEFVLPPGFAVEKLVLFKSSHHKNIPYVTTVNMDMIVDKKPGEAKITFRENNQKYSHFIWYDHDRDVDMDFYLGANLSLAYPTGDFSNVARKKDGLFSSLGINAYLGVLKQFGVNFSLEYQKYEARGRITSVPDSILTLGTFFELYEWQLITFLISPRYVYNLSNELDIFAELAGGVALSISPRAIATRWGLEIYEIESTSAFSLVAGAAVGTRIHLSEKLNLDLKLEYIPVYQANFELEDDLFGSIARKQNMDHLKIKAGLNWKL